MARDYENSEDLPTYSVDGEETERRPKKKKLTKKEKYAVSLQKACNNAVERISSTNMIMNSPWAAGLASAPSAIATMAILFKVADRDEAKGIEIDSQDVMDVVEYKTAEQRAAEHKAAEKNKKKPSPFAEESTSGYEAESATGEETPDESVPTETADTSGILEDGLLDGLVLREPVGRIAGRLPSKYFHTNLQHCSDLGRLAFQDAQHGMNKIQSIARSLVSGSGGIAIILEYLEEPEEARYQLKPEIKAIRASAQECLQTAQKITSKFYYWYLVIMHLNNCSLTKSGEIAKEKGETKSKRAQARKDKAKYEADRNTTRNKIELLKSKAVLAESNVDRAQDELDRINNLPPVYEPSVIEEMERLNRLHPMERAKAKTRGWFSDTKDYWFGRSDKDMREDDNRQQEVYNRIEARRREAMQQEENRRAVQRQRVAQDLEEARKREAKVKEELVGLYGELADSKSVLEKAESDLEQTQIDLKQLSAKKVELKTIMEILSNSMESLSKLKNQVEPLVDFFYDICNDINTNIDGHLEDFLRPIVSGITDGSTPDEIDAIRLGRVAKQRIMSSAMQMQGRFSAIADISRTYILISAEYIRPAITDMEELSKLKEPAWELKRAEFDMKCAEKVAKINEITKVTIARAEENIRKSIGDVQRRAIEAAEDSEDEED